MSTVTDAPIPVILITGYLGAGKTSALKHLLAQPELQDPSIALIINEFGPRGLDGRLVGQGPWTTFEVNKGSVFCVCVKTQLLQTLTDIAENVQPDVVLVEATGIAETSDMESILREVNLAGQFEVRACLCIVDAAHFAQVAPYLKAAPAQVRWADGVVINKKDLVTPEAVEQLSEVLAELNPRADQAVTTHGQIPWSFLEGLAHQPPETDAACTPPENVFATEVSFPEPVEEGRFWQAVDTLSAGVLRMKGHVNFTTGRKLVEVAGGRRRTQPSDDPDDDSGVVVIAYGLSPQEIADAFADLAG